jgi:cytidyltransferase-like protein
MESPVGVIVSGYFSPLHAGHLDMIEDGAARGDILIVIVNNNAQQMIKKGQIIMDEADRLRVVQALRVVDDAMVAVDEDRTVCASIQAVADKYPNHRLIFANGGDRVSGAVVPETPVCEANGIEMVFDLGGTTKADSSSRINQVMGIETEASALPSAVA